MSAARTLYERRVRAVSALQQFHARRNSVMDIVRMLSERRVDAVGTL